MAADDRRGRVLPWFPNRHHFYWEEHQAERILRAEAFFADAAELAREAAASGRWFSAAYHGLVNVLFWSFLMRWWAPCPVASGLLLLALSPLAVVANLLWNVPVPAGVGITAFGLTLNIAGQEFLDWFLDPTIDP